jgi:hypothetical protein
MPKLSRPMSGYREVPVPAITINDCHKPLFTRHVCKNVIEARTSLRASTAVEFCLLSLTSSRDEKGSPTDPSAFVQNDTNGGFSQTLIALVNTNRFPNGSVTVMSWLPQGMA